MLIISLYLEMLVALLSFVILANYEPEVMGVQSMSIFILGANLYLIVFLTSFIRLASQFREKTQEVIRLKAEIKKKDKPTILFRAERKNHNIPVENILYIESLSDYVKVVTVNSELVVREKISKLKERLPSQFIRLHRSFIVNKAHVQSFNKVELVIANETIIPISRTYKEEAMELLKT